MSERFSRQGFLGEDSEEIFGNIRVGIVGLGGGGSYISQQLAHIGVVHFDLFDFDAFEESNINRTVGAFDADIKLQTLKVDISERLIKSVRPNAIVKKNVSKWQNNAVTLRGCDVVFGCLDGFANRRDLEAECRRYLIPLIDIGMDITTGDGCAPYMAGQVILSMPSHPCMHCLNFLTEERLSQEAKKYANAGIRPQVVWPNGALASAAIGVFVDLVTDWTGTLRGVQYFEYLGNENLVREHPLLSYLRASKCNHFNLDEVGPVQSVRL